MKANGLLLPMCFVTTPTFGKEAHSVKRCIGKRRAYFERISGILRESPLSALRQMLPDNDILSACGEVGHRYRNRVYDPVVTVFHYLLQAIQREESFAASWQELWANAALDLGLGNVPFSSSALSQARSRMSLSALEILVRRALAVKEQDSSTWQGFRLLALDCTTVSMPREKELFEHFGVHKARRTTVRYPLGTFSSLLAVKSSHLVDYRFGPFDPGEMKTAIPLLDNLKKGDLLLADRHFAGSPTLARTCVKGADFLMRKHGRLLVEKLHINKRLGPKDFLVEIPMSKIASQNDPSLPGSVTVRIFKASWMSPSGKRVREWFVTSLKDREQFPPTMLARLYHERWRSETSYLEFKVFFHADVLRSKTVTNITKEFTAHVLAYQLLRRLVAEAAKKHKKKPVQLSVLHAARWVISFSARMSKAPAWKLPLIYQALLDAIATTEVDIRLGRSEPRAITRERKHYPRLKITRSEWRQLYLKETG